MIEVSFLGIHSLAHNSPFETLENAVMFVIPIECHWFGSGLAYFAQRLTVELLARLHYNAPFCHAMFPNTYPRTWGQQVDGLAALFHGAVYEALKSQNISMGEWASYTGLAIKLLVSWSDEDIGVEWANDSRDSRRIASHYGLDIIYVGERAFAIGTIEEAHRAARKAVWDCLTKIELHFTPFSDKPAKGTQTLALIMEHFPESLKSTIEASGEFRECEAAVMSMYGLGRFLSGDGSSVKSLADCGLSAVLTEKISAMYDGHETPMEDLYLYRLK